MRQARRFRYCGCGARLALVEGQRAEIDEVAHRGVVTGLGDHRAAVGVAEQDDIALDRVEHATDPVGITMEVREGAGVSTMAGEVDRHGGHHGGGQQRHHPVEAPGAVPAAVDEDRSRGHPLIMHHRAARVLHRRDPREPHDSDEAYEAVLHPPEHLRNTRSVSRRRTERKNPRHQRGGSYRLATDA